jgi:hypothetical protein
MRSLFIIGVLALTLLALPSLYVFGADLAGYGPDVNERLERNLGISHRLALGVPAAVLLFCLLPMIVLLYFLRLKRQPIAVPSTFLWKKSIEDLHVNRLMQWLRKNVLLLLQLLAVLLFIYAALGPRMHGSVSGGRYYILMIDNSASMSATDVKPSRLEWAKAEALRTIDAATDADSGMLIVFNTTAEIRQSYTANREELKAAVRAIEPSQFPTRIDEALALAASRANPNRSTENESAAPANPEPGKERTYFSTEGFAADIFLFSDGRFPNVADFPLENLNIQFPEIPATSVNGTSNNLAIVRFTAERDASDPQKIVVQSGILNFRDKPAEIKVQLDVLVKNEQNAGSFSKQVTIPAKPLSEAKISETNPKERPAEPKPGEVEIPFIVPDVPENADVVLQLSLVHGGDSLPIDDTARLVLGVARKAKVLVVTPGNKLLRNYFDTDSAKKMAEYTYLQPADLASPSDYLTPAREGKYDLVIFDRCAPASEDHMPTANTFFIGYPPPPYKPVGTNDPKAVTPVNGATIRGWLSRHPLMNKLRGLDEIRIADKADVFRFPDLPPRTPKLLEGDAGLVLMAAIARQSFTDVVLAFPVATGNEDGPDRIWHSDWPMLPSFVLFLQNMIKTLGNVRDANTDEPLQPGQIMSIRPGSAKEVFVTKPDGKTAKYDRGSRSEVIYSNTDTVGVYTAEWSGGQVRRFAVNLFDPEESNLAPISHFSIGDTKVDAGASRKEPRELWKYGVVLALAVVLLEWWVYNRRVQI